MKITLKNREDLVTQYNLLEYSKLSSKEKYELYFEITSENYSNLAEIDQEYQNYPDRESRVRSIVIEALSHEFDDFNDAEFLELISTHHPELLQNAAIEKVERKKFLGIF